MFLKSLKLLNFRNYESLELLFNKKKTVIVGGNAQGKTNLVEAIYFLASLDSPRASNDSEYVLWGKDSGYVSGVIDSSSGSISELSIAINPGKQKILKINKVKKSSYKDFLGQLVVVSFSVDDLLLLRGTPKDRRKWIDTAICQLYPAYYNRMQTYNKIKEQKKAFLKTFNAYATNLSSVQISMLESWNDQISTAGSNIIYLREKFLKEIFSLSQNKNLQISGGLDNLTIKYDSSLGLVFSCDKDDLPSIDQIRQHYIRAMNLKKEEEIQKGQVLIGPHRDDIRFYIENKEADTFASQGQQRTIVLSLKLAELELIKNSLKEDPILILDDVLAELDISRQRYLFESIGSGNQTIITTTDVDAFKDKWFDDIDIFNVIRGAVTIE